MIGLMRTGALAVFAALAVTPADAQSLFGDGSNVRRPARAQATAPRTPARAQATAPRQQQASLFSWFGDDDEDEAPRARPAPRAQPRAAAGGAPGPAVRDGGGRPSISPAAPPIVAFTGGQAAGSVVIDTSSRSLYYVLAGNRAYRYPVAVGREGFGWTGTQRVSRVASWPDWRPPAEMRERVPTLPVLMTGGINNPLGAKAIYLGSTLYRIHGTNDARSIGTASSSGCFRMTNSNVLHLAQHVGVGTRVQVMRGLRVPRNIAATTGAARS